MARGRRTDPTAAVLVQVMHEMGFPPAWIAELAEIPRKTVDDIIKGRGIWNQMPRTELYDRAREQLRGLIEQVACNSALKVMERLDAKIENASYMEAIQMVDVLSRIEITRHEQR